MYSNVAPYTPFRYYDRLQVLTVAYLKFPAYTTILFLCREAARARRRRRLDGHVAA